jgi:hypothetical protein
MAEIRNVHIIFVRVYVINSLGRPRQTDYSNAKTYLRDVGRQCVKWGHMAENNVSIWTEVTWFRIMSEC